MNLWSIWYMEVVVTSNVKIWTFILITIVLELIKGQQLLPIYGQWTCTAGRIMPGFTLSGGIHAGSFMKVGTSTTMPICIQHCCNEENCHVAFMARNNCYLVSCNNNILCRPVPAKNIGVHPQISYVTHHGGHPKIQAGIPHLQSSTVALKSQEIPIYTNPSQNYGALNPNRLDALNHQSVDQTAGMHPITTQELAQKRVYIDQKKAEIIQTKDCFPAKVHKGVSLKHGPNAGEFYDYGKIGSMRQCVTVCCSDKSCDAAFMVSKTCYTLNCYSFEKCGMISAAKNSILKSQLAYVIKKRDITGQQRLKMMPTHGHKGKGNDKEATVKKDENVDNKQRHVPGKKHDLIEKARHHGKSTAPLFKSERDHHFVEHNAKSSEDSNIPDILVRNCDHGEIFKNHGITGGLRSGIYHFRGVTPGFLECLKLCCTDMFCDAAFLLGKRCYSIQCYKDRECSNKPARGRKLHSLLSFVKRLGGDDHGNKRTSIPALLPSDRQYTIWLNITSEEYKKEMDDSESLEYLNFAEMLKSAVTDLYGNVDGFKYVEILKFKPNILLAVFNITADESVMPKTLIGKMVEILRTGEMKVHEEPVIKRIRTDVRGFRFINKEGDNMICPPEYDYEVHWPLGVYDTSVNVPCPKKANGLVTRLCSDRKTYKVLWMIPDFSACISEKYLSLLREVKDLISKSAKNPEITVASIIDRLLQLVTVDTYGANPPYRAGGKTSKTFEGAYDNVPEEVPFVKPGSKGEENFGIDKLRAALQKMKLSALQSKVGKTDMMSLYKSLTSNAKVSLEPQTIQGWKSVTHTGPKALRYSKVKDRHFAKFPNVPRLPFDSPGNFKPLALDSDKLKTGLHSSKISPYGETFWTKQYPIAKPDSQVLEDLGIGNLQSAELLNKQYGGAQPDSPGNYIFDSIKPHSEPAGIEKIEYEPIDHQPIAENQGDFNVIPDIELRKVNPMEDDEFPVKGTGNSGHHHINQQMEAKGSLISEKEITNANLAKYYSSTNLQPNGVPIYEDKKDKTPSHPHKYRMSYGPHDHNVILTSVRKRSVDNNQEYEFPMIDDNNDDIFDIFAEAPFTKRSRREVKGNTSGPFASEVHLRSGKVCTEEDRSALTIIPKQIKRSKEESIINKNDCTNTAVKLHSMKDSVIPQCLDSFTFHERVNALKNFDVDVSNNLHYYLRHVQEANEDKTNEKYFALGHLLRKVRSNYETKMSKLMSNFYLPLSPFYRVNNFYKPEHHGSVVKHIEHQNNLPHSKAKYKLTKYAEGFYSTNNARYPETNFAVGSGNNNKNDLSSYNPIPISSHHYHKKIEKPTIVDIMPTGHPITHFLPRGKKHSSAESHAMKLINLDTPDNRLALSSVAIDKDLYSSLMESLRGNDNEKRSKINSNVNSGVEINYHNDARKKLTDAFAHLLPNNVVQESQVGVGNTSIESSIEFKTTMAPYRHHSTQSLYIHSTKSLLSKAIDSYVAYINCEPHCVTNDPHPTHHPMTIAATSTDTTTTTAKTTSSTTTSAATTIAVTTTTTTTTSTGTTTSPTKSAFASALNTTRRSKKKTKSSSTTPKVILNDVLPTIDPDYQDIDETEPEKEVPVLAPNSMKEKYEPTESKDESVDEPVLDKNQNITKADLNPEIYITIINKSKEIEYGNKTVKNISLAVTVDKHHPQHKVQVAAVSEIKITHRKKPTPNRKTTQKKKTTPKKKTTRKKKATQKKKTPTKKKVAKKKENDLIFAYDAIFGIHQAPMFGGNILIAAEILERLSKYDFLENTQTTLPEEEEYLEVGSAMFDLANKNEWKHGIQHMSLLRNGKDTDEDEIADDELSKWVEFQRKKILANPNHDPLISLLMAIQDFGKMVVHQDKKDLHRYKDPIVTKNLIMHVHVVNEDDEYGNKKPGIIFPNYEDRKIGAQWKPSGDHIIFPTKVLEQLQGSNKQTIIIFFIFDTIHNLQRNSLYEERKSPDGLLDDHAVRVDTSVFAVDVTPGLSKEMVSPVSFILRSDNITDDSREHKCGYWNLTENVWRDDGCETTYSNFTHTACKCNMYATYGAVVDTTLEVAPILKPFDEVGDEKIERIEEKVKVKMEKMEPIEKSAPVLHHDSTTTPPPLDVPAPASPETTISTTTEKRLKSTAATKKQHALHTEDHWHWWWILLILLLILLLLLLIVLCCWYCVCRRGEDDDEDNKDPLTESSNTESAISCGLVDKSKRKHEAPSKESKPIKVESSSKHKSQAVQRPRKRDYSSKSASSSRSVQSSQKLSTGVQRQGKSKGIAHSGSSSTKSDSDSSALRKWVQNSKNPNEMLLKEKSLLFKDYVQPYHFLSHEKGRPETSSESLYGSSFSAIQTAKSESSPIKKKRSYLPKTNKPRTLLSSSKDDEYSKENLKPSASTDKYNKRESTESSSKHDTTDSSSKGKQKQKIAEQNNVSKDHRSSGSTEKESSAGIMPHEKNGQAKKYATPQSSKRDPLEDSASSDTRDGSTARTSDMDIYSSKHKASQTKNSSSDAKESPSSPDAQIRNIRKYKQRGTEIAKEPSSVTARPVKRDYINTETLNQRSSDTKQKSKSNIMSLPLSQATSMEWDPFVSQKHRETQATKQMYPRRRQISPISEEATTDMSITRSSSTEAQLGGGTDDSSSTTFDTTYHNSASALANSATDYSDNSRSPPGTTKTTSSAIESAYTVHTDNNTSEISKTSTEKSPARSSRPVKRDYTSLDPRYKNNK